MSAAYLAPEGFEVELDDELARAGVPVAERHGRLRLTDAPAVRVAWAANVWFDAEIYEVPSIRAAADVLRSIQRSWAVYAPEHRGRARLVAERLPHVSARPLAWHDPVPSAPLGSWTLLAPDLMLASARCSSPFPNGEPAFVEDHDGPPSTAYLKLWEAFVRLDRRPGPGDRCLDLGASPGGWSWLLARCGADVLAVDKARPAPRVAALPGVEWRQDSAFALAPPDLGRCDWWCSDVVAYPRRLLALVERWLAHGDVGQIVCSVKLQGATDHAVVADFAALPGAELVHLHHNKHELTLLLPGTATSAPPER